MTTHAYPTPVSQDNRKTALAKRLDDMGWGLFLIMTGAIWLVPAERVPPGTWLIGTGLLLLALNLVRYFNRMGTSGLASLLGALALAGGLADFAGIKLPLLAICLVVIGAGIILKPLLARRN